MGLPQADYSRSDVSEPGQPWVQVPVPFQTFCFKGFPEVTRAIASAEQLPALGTGRPWPPALSTSCTAPVSSPAASPRGGKEELRSSKLVQ